MGPLWSGREAVRRLPLPLLLSCDSAPSTSDPPHPFFFFSATPLSSQTLDLLSYLAAALVPAVFVAAFHGPAIVFMFVYLWSRQFPEAQARAFFRWRRPFLLSLLPLLLLPLV